MIIRFTFRFFATRFYFLITFDSINLGINEINGVAIMDVMARMVNSFFSCEYIFYIDYCLTIESSMGSW